MLQLGKTNIQTQLHLQYHFAIVKHNEQVDKNKYLVNMFIHYIQFCDALELSPRGKQWNK